MAKRTGNMAKRSKKSSNMAKRTYRSKKSRAASTVSAVHKAHPQNYRVACRGSRWYVQENKAEEIVKRAAAKGETIQWKYVDPWWDMSPVYESKVKALEVMYTRWPVIAARGADDHVLSKSMVLR